MLALVKTYLKKSPLYPYYFAWKNAIPPGVDTTELQSP